MPLSCPRCTRLNPDDAIYCFSDGLALRAYQAPVASNRLGRAFVFPSGRTCNTFDELAKACLEHWVDARDLLRTGMFAGYFGGLGRIDLARAAQEAAKNPDPDRGLDQLIARLPVEQLAAPSLYLGVTDIDLGTLVPGKDHDFEIRVKNQGSGLLHGSISCQDSYWIGVGAGAGQKQKLFQTLKEETIKLHVRGKVLRASNKPIEAKLVVQSSGGDATITVRARVPVRPFNEGCLAGAMSPRQLAEKAKANTKDAIPIFESGSVARWYETNGWSYPVQGPTAAGLGAVQQFFEALGLVSPPKIDISHRTLSFRGAAGAELTETLQLSTTERRPVYASGLGDKPWLKAGKSRSGSRHYELPVIVRVPGDARAGDNLQATLVVTGNGNQKFFLPVSVAVTAAASAATLPMPPTIAPAPAPYSLPPPVAVMAAPAAVLPIEAALAAPDEAAASQPSRKKNWLPYAPVGFLVLALLTTFVRDLATKPPGEVGDDDEVAEAEVKRGDPKELLQIKFHDKVRDDVEIGGGGGLKGEPNMRGTPVLWDPSMRFGLAHVSGETTSKLTYEPMGWTNNAVVKIDGAEGIFGDLPLRVRATNFPIPLNTGLQGGRWRGNQPFSVVPDTQARRSVWEYPRQKVSITQHVERILSQSGDYDTALIRYTLENQDTREHEVGLRFLLDTFIGKNDGVPFLIPGQQQLISTTFESSGATDIPAFIQAREKQDLESPGTICQLGLKVDGLTPPDRFTLGAYPVPQLFEIDQRCRQEKTLWDVPVLNIQLMTGDLRDQRSSADSCVVIYWNPRTLRPGEKREVGFTYGLGYLVTSGQNKNQLALTSGGNYKPDGEITVTAYISNPEPGSKVTLKLPKGFSFDGDVATKDIKPPDNPKSPSPVSWKVRAGGRGRWTFTAETTNKLKGKHAVTISDKRLFGG